MTPGTNSTNTVRTKFGPTVNATKSEFIVFSRDAHEDTKLSLSGTLIKNLKKSHKSEKGSIITVN